MIVDELDWVFFDGSVAGMEKSIQFFCKAKQIISLTGSTLTLKED